MKFRRRRERESVEINLASLIDVVFILLLFFVVTTTFTRETQLKVDLPEADSGAVAEQQLLEILISADGTYALNGKPLLRNDLQGLQGALNDASGGDTRLPVTISADANTPHQAVVTAMDAAGKLGFAHLRITTVQAESKP